MLMAKSGRSFDPLRSLGATRREKVTRWFLREGKPKSTPAVSSSVSYLSFCCSLSTFLEGSGGRSDWLITCLLETSKALLGCLDQTQSSRCQLPALDFKFSTSVTSSLWFSPPSSRPPSFVYISRFSPMAPSARRTRKRSQRRRYDAFAGS